MITSARLVCQKRRRSILFLTRVSFHPAESVQQIIVNTLCAIPDSLLFPFQILGNLFSFVIITSHDDMSRNLKIIMHELAKQYKTDIRQEKFLVSLLSGRTFMTHSIMSQLKAEDQPLRDRKLLLFGDVILAAEALMMMTRYKDDVANGISLCTVRFSSVNFVLSGNTGVFTTALASLQNLSIEFLSTSSRKWFLPSQEATRSFLRKIFFLEKHSMFQIMDKWPTEHERT